MPQGLGEERLKRLLTILAILPSERHKNGISTSEILSCLTEAGYEVNMRTLQRDMKLLEEAFLEADQNLHVALTYKGQDPENRSWKLLKPLIGMNYEQANALLLAEQILEPILPTPVLDRLLPYFKEARERFFKTAKVMAKERKVDFVPWGFNLLHPDFRGKQKAVDVIFEALFNEKRFKGTYRSRGAEKSWEAVFNPLAYVGREGGGYLVATWGNSDQPRHLHLHRFEKAEPLEEPIPEGIVGTFRLSEYIKTFAYPLGDKPIRIKLKLNPDIAQPLKERRLSEDQEIKDEEGFAILTATVDDTEALRWWILGYGANLEVLEPLELRQEIAKRLKETASRYAS